MSQGLRTTIGLAAVVFASMASAAGPPTLLLDGLSFLHFEGAGSDVAVPTSGPIDVQLSELSSNQWALTITPEQLEVPPIVYPSGKAAQWRLSANATGTLTRTASGWRSTISAPLVAYVEGNEAGIPMPLEFTTELATEVAGQFVAQREGARLDPESGYLQLVAAGVNPMHAATAPGKPFYVVLSGRILNLPEEMAAE